MVGQRDRPQVQPRGLLDELLRGAGAVEKAVGRVRVQFGVRDRRAADRMPRRAVVGPLAGPGRTVAAVAGRFGQRQAGPAGLATEHPLHLAPARRPVTPAHPRSLSNNCSNGGGAAQDLRATMTGIFAAWATELATEPSSIPVNPPRPWLPTTKSCAFSACLTSALAGRPHSTTRRTLTSG